MASPKEQLGQILAFLSENSKGINELKTSMSEMRTLHSEILQWKPDVDHRIHELEHVVLDLREKVEHALEALLPQVQLKESIDA
ncbi:unnamed protein product [Miscanthus lutarioriparius]|uniref:Uncharacterized protein n=1 Tax=Miscanthus lutarioriparius TaxID=422564 RepID=A0A811RET9_9POAL|nr:unnamed protein product [Miscanthus lutarioriparius]